MKDRDEGQGARLKSRSGSALRRRRAPLGVMTYGTSPQGQEPLRNRTKGTNDTEKSTTFSLGQYCAPLCLRASVAYSLGESNENNRTFEESDALA